MREESRDIGFKLLKKYTEQMHEGQEIKVVIGGGDGTIMWVIESIIDYQIDAKKCAIIPFPFGTGNDFSNTLGEY